MVSASPFAFFIGWCDNKLAYCFLPALITGYSGSGQRRDVILPPCCISLSLTWMPLQVSKDDVKKSKKTWDKVYEMFKKAEVAASGDKSDKTKEREAARADLAVSTPYPDDTHLLKNQVKIIWGNALYDQSQVPPRSPLAHLYWPGSEFACL